MTDFALLNPLVLAFMGDAYITLAIREKYISSGHKIDALHKMVSQKICAKYQSTLYEKVKPTFTQIESDIANRARNAGHKTTPKNCTLHEYRQATALEAVVGYNYLINNHQRCMELITEET